MANDNNSIELEVSLQRIKDEMYVRSQCITEEPGYLRQKDRDSLELRRSLSATNSGEALRQ